MNKLITGILAGMAIMTTMAMAINYEVKNSTAEVEQIQGIYIFTDSKPVREFEYLGTASNGIGISSQYQGVRDRLIKNAKKEYPSCDAIILHLNSNGFDKADVIRFK